MSMHKKIFVRVCLSLFLSNTSRSGYADEIFIDPSLRDLDLKPKIVERNPISEPGEYHTTRSQDALIDLNLGQLSQIQYEGLSAFYRHSSKVPYDPNRSYLLTDFLTPQMQALYGMDFKAELTHRVVADLSESRSRIPGLEGGQKVTSFPWAHFLF